MTAFLALRGDILAEAPQATVVAIQRSVRRAVREFCRKTYVLRTTTDPLLDIDEGEAEYELPAVGDREIVGIVRDGVWWRDSDPYQLVDRTEDQLDRDFLHVRTGRVDPWKTLTANRPTYFYQPLPNTIRLVPIPNADHEATLEVTYALMPSLEATEVDDFVMNRWYEHIVKGALAELFSIPQQPWSNQRRADQKRAEFDVAIAEVISERVSGFANNDYAVGRVRAYP